jgi:hypothetical protein
MQSSTAAPTRGTGSHASIDVEYLCSDDVWAPDRRRVSWYLFNETISSPILPRNLERVFTRWETEVRFFDEEQVEWTIVTLSGTEDDDSGFWGRVEHRIRGSGKVCFGGCIRTE